MKRFVFFVLTLVVMGSFLFPALVTHAQLPAGETGGFVTCGKGADPCTFQDLMPFLSNLVTKLLTYIAVPLATLGIAIGGVRIIVGSQNPGERSKGVENIKDSVIGLIIALAAWLIVQTILAGLGYTGFNPLGAFR